MQLAYLTNMCIFKQNQHFETMITVSIFALITCFLLLMRLLALHGVAGSFVGKLQKFHP